MFKPSICSWRGFLPMFILILPIQVEFGCVAKADKIEPFLAADAAKVRQQVEQAINSSVNLVPCGLSASHWKVHRGDLVVEGNIESNKRLIVLCNLTVRSDNSSFSLSNPWVVLGIVAVTNMVSDSPVLITGSRNT
ncbi:methylglyoxal detoxification protein, partial [Escherichia coli]|uniref:methylglyoxal detoxification protein n=1 Tax=Escherichia coli TaxID=562 RepID=UPI000C292519